MTIEQEIKKPHSKAFRRCFIKRRLSTTGLFEADWHEISSDVIKWGKVSTKVDVLRNEKFKFSNVKVTVDNNRGRYNPEDNNNSLWFGYASMQRSLLKIEAGFEKTSMAASGIITKTEFPSNTSMFIGLISGDMRVRDDDRVALNVKPLNQLFVDYPASELTGYTSTGLTASKFCELMRDHTDGAGEFIFRPFFGDTTTNWLITTTTTNYLNLDTSTAKDVRDKSCWKVLEKLSEAEQFTPYINRFGQFVFGSSDPATTSSYIFNGPNVYDGKYGITIKKVNGFGKKISNFYSRIEVKFKPEDTATSFVTTQTSMVVGPTNDSWNLGYRTFKMDNNYLATLTAAQIVAQNIFTSVSSLKNEIGFTTSFIPHLNPLSRITINYDAGTLNPGSLWDQADWDTELTWDKEDGVNIVLDNIDFKTLNVEVDLDKLETKFSGREI